MKKKLLTALQAYFNGRKELLENTIKQNEGVKENGLSAEEIQRIKDDLARVTELVSSLQESEEGDDEETIRKKITEIISKGDTQVMNECKEYMENSFRLWKIATENSPATEAKTKEFKKLYENQIKALQTQLGVQVFENALTITPSGSLPVPTAVAMAEPAVVFPDIFDYADEAVDGVLVGAPFRGAKLRVIKVTSTNNSTTPASAVLYGATGEGVNKPITDVTMSATDVDPLKVAVVIENVTVEQIEFNDWLEATLKIYATKLLFANLETAAVSILNANSVAYDETSAAGTATVAFLENVAVAGVSQLAAANYYGRKRTTGRKAYVAFVNVADWVNNMNAQTTQAYPIENRKIVEHIEFIPSGAVPAGTMYVADPKYLKKKMYKDVFVERAISHTHASNGTRNYPNATDYIFDVLAYFFVEDAGAVVKIDIAEAKEVVENPPSEDVPTISGASAVDFAAAGGTKNRTYSTSDGSTVMADTEAEWLSVSVASGNKVVFTAAAYAGTEADRTAEVTITIPETTATKTVTVTQAKAE